MKAARFYGPKDLRVDEVPEPPVKGSQIKIKVLILVLHETV